MSAKALALALAVAASSAVAGVEAHSAESAPTHVVTQPDWRERPTPELIQSFYPVGAAKLRVDGQAAVTCRVRATGALDECRIYSETPMGYGFGEAALLMAQKFQMKPMTIDGVPSDGGRITIPVNFHMPPKTWAQKMGLVR